MWFGHGTKPHEELGYGQDDVPASVGERIRLLGLTAFAGLPIGKRNHAHSRFDRTRQIHLQTAMQRWIAGRHLSRQDFAQTMFGATADGPGVRAFHDAALSLGNAERRRHLRDATDAFASGMLDIGLDFFPRFLAGAAERAEQAGTGLLTPVQSRRGSAGGPVQAPGGRMVDATPSQELLIVRYNFALRRLRQLEPANSYSTSIGPLNTVPSEELVGRIEQEMRAADLRAQTSTIPSPEMRPPLGIIDSNGLFSFRRAPSEHDVFGRRDEPGIVPWVVLPSIRGPWLTLYMPEGAPVPGQVAAQMVGRTFKDFDAFRKRFWEAVANTPELVSQFSPSNRTRMQNGLAPATPIAGQGGRRRYYELHHDLRIRWNGAIYDLRNLVVTMPKDHIDLHRAER